VTLLWDLGRKSIKEYSRCLGDGEDGNNENCVLAGSSRYDFDESGMLKSPLIVISIILDWLEIIVGAARNLNVKGNPPEEI